MALNPPISMAGIPLRLEGEYLMLERKHIEAEFKIPVFGKKTGKGKLYITTARMVFVNGEFSKNEFKSFDIPLPLPREVRATDFRIKLPFRGTVKPIYGLLPGDTTFKLWFTSGGCQTFLNCFCRVVDQIRKGGRKGPDQRFLDQVRLGQFAGQKGFVDPNDPSVIYVSQPSDTYNNVFSNQAQGQNYYGQGYNFQGQGVMLGSNDPDVQKQMNSQQNLNAQQNHNQPPPQNYIPPAPENYNPAPGYNNQQNFQPPPQGYQNYQPPPQNYQPGPQNYPPYQPPAQNYQQPAPQNYQPPPQNYQPQPQYYQPPPQNNQPPSQDYRPPAQNYQPSSQNHPASQPQNYQGQNNQPPQQNSVPPADFLSENQNNQVNQNNQNQNANNQQQQMNVAYYYGIPIGPQLKKNY